MVDVERAALLMEEALQLLDAAGLSHAAALLDYAITQLPPGSNEVREMREPAPEIDDDNPAPR
jgi:hypothetical protein